jgi:hypothetical protein
MLTQTIAFSSVVLAALALVPAMARVLEMRNKLALSRAEYKTVQQLYRGWSLAGVVVVGALLATALLAYQVRHDAARFALALSALGCIVATQVVFWTWTFPVNKATSNWTVLPDDWEALRRRWERSHAASAVLNLAALLCLSALLAREVAWESGLRQACHTPNPFSRNPIASSTSISRAASYGIGL